MMPDMENVIKGLERCKEGGSCDGCQYDINSSKCMFLLHADAIALLKEQDYRSWLMDMFHKYGRDDLIALLVLHGEENLLADVLKEHGETELCDRCGRRRLKSNMEVK